VKLRTAILLILFVFAMMPMIAMISLNLPIVLEKLETFVRGEQLQRMRVEFGDLDQFMASRKEMVRVLAKLPNPEVILGVANEPGESTAEDVPAATLNWVNQILRAGQDIYEVLYMSRDGAPRLRMVRDRLGEPLRLADVADSASPVGLFRTAMSLQPDGVFVGPIRFSEKPLPESAFHPMTLPMTSPLVDERGTSQGVVVVSSDVGGLPNAYPNTLWAMADGSYLTNSSMPQPGGDALADFPGLQELFAKGVIGVWNGPHGEQAVWVPLFSTEHFGPLWVGRRLDPSAVQTFRRDFEKRVLLITVLLLLSALVVARWMAQRVAIIGDDLKRKIKRVLNDEPGVEFNWRGTAELKALGTDLTRLADAHARTARDLKNRARELEDAYRYKSQFLANMSHELRTPLNSMLLLSKLLAENDEGNLNGEQVRQCRVIHTAGKGLLGLIDDILDISRMEAGKGTVHLERIDPHDFWLPLLEMFEPLAAEKGLELKGHADPDLPPGIVSDGEKLSQILKNFLSNAIKFTEQGSIVLRVTRNRGSDAAERPLAISVQDTGVGIPADKQKLIFGAFQQADGSTSRRYGGTGLGLAISHGMAKLLGGRIDLSSVERHGATFTVYLPLELDVSALDAERVSFDRGLLDETASDGGAGLEQPVAPLVSTVAIAEDSSPAAALPELLGRRILLIEHDVRRLLFLTPLLEDWGVEVTAAASLEEALEVLVAEPTFDVVVVDCEVPEAGSPVGVRAIAAQAGDRAMEILVVTGKLDGAEARAYMDAGAAALLPAPLEPALLRQSLTQRVCATDDLSAAGAVQAR
jgi:signal transduction histidine kinase/ActR/RegA family two-component response regulator